MDQADVLRRPIDIPRQAGLYVRRAREARGVTRCQLAGRAGVSERLLASLELGDAPGIRLDKLLAIFDAVGLSLMVEDAPDKGVSARAGKGVGGAASQQLPQQPKNASGTCGLLEAYNDVVRDFISQVERDGGKGIGA